MHREQLEGFTADLSFRDLVSVLKRHRLLIYINLALFLGIAVVVSSATAPRYRSVARVLIEDAPRQGVVDVQDPLVAMQTQDSVFSVPTQIEVLQSNDIVFQALKRADLPIPTTQEDLAKLPAIKVEQVADTNVVQISVDSPSQEICSKLAASLPTVYREYVQLRQRDAVARALTFVEDRVTKETAALGKATQSLEQFRKAHRVVDTNAELNVRLSGAEQASSEVAAADAQVKAAQAELDEAIKARRALPPLIDVPTTQTNVQQIEAEKLRLEQLEQQRKTLLVTYKDNSMPIRKIDAEIASQKAYIASLSANVSTRVKTRNPDIPSYDQRVAEARAQLSGARARAADMRRNAGNRDKKLRNLNPVNREQADLERKVDDSRNALARLADTADRLRLRNNSLKVPVSNITEASIPVQVAPRWTLNLAVAFILGLVLGCFFALARDTMLDRVNSERDVRLASGLDILARLPLTPRRMSPLVWRNGSSLSLDRYRLLRSNLVLASDRRESGLVRQEDEEFRPSLLLPYNSPNLTSLMVTSTFQNEGKSVVAANLATAMAMDGRRVILVDANLRVPSVHKSFDVRQSPGLSDVLLGKAQVDDVLQPTPVENLSVLAAGELPLNPSGMLASAEMLELHESLKSKADVVIYDSVSSYALADAQALAAIVGSVLYVTQLGAAKKDDMHEAVSTLGLTNAQVLGVVVNKDPDARIVLS